MNGPEAKGELIDLAHDFYDFETLPEAVAPAKTKDTKRLKKDADSNDYVLATPSLFD